MTVVLALVAVAASTVAVVRGVDELTSGARLRNLEAVLRANSSGTTNGSTDLVLNSLHRATLGKMVARDGVPMRKFLFPVVMTFFFPLNIAWIIATSTTVVWNQVVIWTVFMFLATWPAVRGWLHLVRERARIVRCFRLHLAPIRAVTDTMARWEVHKARALVGTASVAMGLILAATGVGLMLRPAANLKAGELLVAVIGALLLIFGSCLLSALVQRDTVTEPRSPGDSLGPSWVHPSGVRDQSSLNSHAAPPVTS